ncbi:unnamed protein product, partial [Ectocarpus sp. 8 AP-2014]
IIQADTPSNPPSVPSRTASVPSRAPLLAPVPPPPPFVPSISTLTSTCPVLARRLGRSCVCSITSAAASGISTASFTLSGWARHKNRKPRRRQALSCGARASSLETR